MTTYLTIGVAVLLYSFLFESAAWPTDRPAYCAALALMMLFGWPVMALAAVLILLGVWKPRL